MSENPPSSNWLSRIFGAFFSKSGDYKQRYGRASGSNSVDYRRNRRALHRGEVPQKIHDLAGIIPGDKVVDVGAGEGILALTLAANKQQVRAIDVTPRRHESGLALQADWAAMGRKVDNCEMVLGDATADPSLLDGFDTLIASRVIYYFGAGIDPFIAEAARRVRYICLVGNPSRNRRYAQGKVPADIGEDVVYSTPQGMQELLERHGFKVIKTADYTDPIVIGERIQSEKPVA